jgi:hypothetical protein
VGSIAPDEDPPHQLPRDAIESAIKDRGFQLWRMKAKAAQS